MTRPMTEKSKTREVLGIAFPAVLESLVSVIITAIDTKMISVLGKGAISAVSYTVQPKLIVFSVFFALGTAVSMFVSQAYGKKDAEEANACLISILRIAVLFSLCAGILLFFLARPVMMLCNRQPDTLEMSITFFRIVMLFCLFQAVSIILNAALRGIGKTKVTLISGIAMGAVDIVVNYLLIEGHFGFPRLEVAGDAIGTVAGTMAACAVSVLAIRRESGFLSLRGFFSPERHTSENTLKNIRSKTGNIIIENLFMRIGFLLSSIILSGLGSGETAVYYVGMILLNYSFAFGDGIQSAVVALTGKSIGAHRYQDLHSYIRISAGIAVACSFLLSLLYVAGSRWFFSLYFTDAKALNDGFTTSCIAALLTLLQILRIVAIGVLRGMGEVKDPRRISTLCVFALNPALSLLLTSVCHFGIWGIWLASVITQVIWFLLSLLTCRRHLASLPA